MKEHWKAHFRDIMHAEITAAYNEDSQRQRAIIGSVEMRQQNQIVEYEDAFRAEMLNVHNQHRAEMHSVNNHHQQVVQNIEQNAALNHDAAINTLRDELAIAANVQCARNGKYFLHPCAKRKNISSEPFAKWKHSCLKAPCARDDQA